MSGDESPPLLDREYSPSDDTFAIMSQDVSVNGKMDTFTLHDSKETFGETKPTQLKLPTDDSIDRKYPAMTPGGTLGMRRQQRTVTEQPLNNNLTLDQLNPPLAEALAAMKSKNGVISKSGNNSSVSISNGYTGRRELLPTRMSGPVTLEALAPSNSNTTDGNVATSGHLVSFNGLTTEVPEEIHCHLCDYPMKLCIRKSKYKGEIREYAAYRCLRKGCQTFRSVRKVIEPDLSLPRKRKLEESAVEASDACNVSSRSDDNSVERKSHSDTDNHGDGSNKGTLVFIPGIVTKKHMEAMQKFTFDLLGGATGPLETTPRPLFAFVKMNTWDVNCLLKTQEGLKKLEFLLMNAPQPSTPEFIIKACENLANMYRASELTKANVARIAPAFLPQMGNTVFPQVENTVLPQVENTVLSQVENTVLSQTDNTVFPRIENTVFPQMENIFAPQIGSTFVPQVGNAVFPQVENIVSPQIENTFVPQMGNTVIPQMDNTVIPQMGNTVIPQMGNTVIPQMGNAVIPQMSNTVIPQVSNTVIPQMGSPAERSLLPQFPDISQFAPFPNYMQSVPCSEGVIPPIQTLYPPANGVHSPTQGLYPPLEDLCPPVRTVHPAVQDLYPPAHSLYPPPPLAPLQFCTYPSYNMTPEPLGFETKPPPFNNEVNL
ncbi:unnamed protein product [Angiostrongylus costaricensis]|uniref:Nuclear receptor domain-containing protein n=1 Tax=Angiostrongylus costaricensis TaxID=334426 RepID=A0A0R3PFL2_ANGCS|nr:unnamed protein product [Angiostrongylus costaricensis]